MLDHIPRDDVLRVHNVIEELLNNPLAPLFKVAATYNKSFAKEYVALDSILDSQHVHLYRNPRAGGGKEGPPLMNIILGQYIPK